MRTIRNERKRLRYGRMIPAILVAMMACPGMPEAVAEDQETALEASTRALLEAYNEGDAEAISSLFVEGGELVLSTGEMVTGRAELRAHYEDVFSNPDRAQAALEVGSIRLLTETLAIEDGTVHLTSPTGAVSSFFYQAVRTKQGDEGWKLASLRDVQGDETLPSDKLSELEWLIGDWLIQVEGGDTWITFFPSDAGPFLEAKAISESPEAPATAATMRIGWNEMEEAFRSWGFDVRGGFNESNWFLISPGEYLLRTTGVTADGERNTATQILKLSDDGQSFTWTKRDQVIGGETLPDRTITVVKRPPRPGGGSPELE